MGGPLCGSRLLRRFIFLQVAILKDRSPEIPVRHPNCIIRYNGPRPPCPPSWRGELPRKKPSLDRLKHEALSITGGGVDTIKNALVTASYGIISNQGIHKRLHEELVKAMPDPNGKPLTVPEYSRLL
jgi:hypothetical protein